MTTNQLGIRNSNIIVPYTASTKRTKQLDLSVSCAHAGWTLARAVGVFYADSAGKWRLTFSITGTMTARSDFTLTLNNVVSKNVANNYQAITVGGASFAGATGAALSASPNTTLTGIYALSFAYLLVSGDIELDSEPTTYTTAANMEGVLPVDVYIPPVSSGVAGIFPALNTELDNVTATRLGLKQYLHGTTYNGGNAPTLTCAQAGFSVNRAVFVPYQCQDGSWRVKFNVSTSFTPATITGAGITVNGLIGKNISGFYQSISCVPFSGSAAVYQAYIAPNTSTLTGSFASSSQGGILFSGDVELESKPTWAY